MIHDRELTKQSSPREGRGQETHTFCSDGINRWLTPVLRSILYFC